MIAFTSFALNASILRTYQSSIAFRTGLDLFFSMALEFLTFTLVLSCETSDWAFAERGATSDRQVNARATTNSIILFIASSSLCLKSNRSSELGQKRAVGTECL